MLIKSLAIKVPRLGISRLGVYYVRTSVRTVVSGRKVIQRSLGTKDPNLAKILALKFCLSLASEDTLAAFDKTINKYELDLAAGKAKADNPEDHARMIEAMKVMADLRAMSAQHAALQTAPASIAGATAPSATLDPALAQLLSQGLATQAKPTEVGIKLKDALDKHLIEEARVLKSSSTLGEKKVLFAEFSEHFGDVHLNSVTKIDISERWRSAEFNRPNKKREDETLSIARLEKRRGYLSKFFDWAINRGSYHHANPMEQRMGTKKEIRAKQQSYAEFTAEDLNQLFNANYAQHMKQPDWYWVPLIALFSGARLGEIASLKLAHIQIVEGVHVFDIMSGKTQTSLRRVPIHSQLLKLGLWDYVEKLKAMGFDRLFPNRPELKPEKMVGRQWAEWIEKCGIEDKRKTFHSFRSTVITQLHNAGAPAAGIQRVVGHAVEGMNGVHAKYVREIQLALMRDTIEAIVYKDLDLVPVRCADPSFTKVLESTALKEAQNQRRAALQQARSQAVAKSSQSASKRKKP